MKILKISFLALAMGCLVFFSNCGGGGGDEPTAKETKTKILVDNSPWTLTSIDLPEVNATEEADWDNFEVTFSATQMTTSGHATGAQVVWPSGGWTANDNLTEITRASDGVKMTVQTLTESTLTVTFTIPEGTEIGGRTAALGGQYTFTLAGSN